MTTHKTSPDHKDVVALRESAQRRDGLGITAAQDRCAAAVHVTRRNWQQWERGDRKMHPGLWELANAKLDGKLSIGTASPDP